MQQVVLDYKIGFREGVHTLGFGDLGSGVRGRSQGPDLGFGLGGIILGERR